VAAGDLAHRLEVPRGGDDDPRLAPTQCSSTPGTEARPTQVSATTAPALPQIDVTPNLDDKVAGAAHLRWIELWAAVDGAGEQRV